MGEAALGEPVTREESVRTRRAVATTVLVVTVLACGATFAVSAAPRSTVLAAITGIEPLGFDGVLRQRRANDCGAAALAMVLGSLGRPADLDVLERELLIGPRGVSMLALKDTAERHGLEAAGLRVDWKGLGRLPLPAIAFVQGDHFVVLLRAGSSHVELADPARGRLRLTRRAFERRWRGEVLSFRPRHGAPVQGRGDGGLIGKEKRHVGSTSGGGDGSAGWREHRRGAGLRLSGRRERRHGDRRPVRMRPLRARVARCVGGRAALVRVGD
jgi:predicted double-glycine peptidase